MSYTPNPDDATQPEGNVPAQTAAAEFRALKGKVNNIEAATGNKIPVRQSVLYGPVLAGLPSSIVLSATALGVDLKGATTGVYLAFANGFSSAGTLDSIQVVAADLANFWPSCAIWNTTFLAVDRTAVGNPTPQKILPPPQYGRLYDRTQASILQFGGAAASTTFLDDFGNTWAAQGGARVQNNQFKFGTGGLGGDGAANILDGVNDYINSASFTPKLWNKSWFIRGWFYAASLPAAGNKMVLRSFTNAGGFGIQLHIDNTGGTVKFGYSLSGDGASDNIANNAVGTTTPLVNTWYFVELTRDKLNGTYKLFVDGTAEQSTASAVDVCPTTLAAIAAKAGGSSFFSGYMDKQEMGNYCAHPGGVAYSVPVAAPSIATAGYASDFFSLFDWKMYKMSVASSAAGSNPTMEEVSRLYIGEADANAAAIVAVRPYAYQGYYEGAFAAVPAAGTAISNSHNIGTKWLKNKRIQLLCLAAEAGYVPGDVIDGVVNTNATPSPMPQIPWNDELLIGVTLGNAGSLQLFNKTTGALANLTSANWNYRLIAERGF